MDKRTPGHADRLLAAVQTALGHELPNRLVAVQGLLRILELEAGDRLDAEQLDYVRRTAVLARRAHALASELTSLVRISRQPLDLVPVNLTEIASEVAAELKQSSPEGIAIVVTAEAPGLELPSTTLRQILSAVIRSRLTRKRSLKASLGAARCDGGWRLWVTDDSPAPIPEQPFEPFAGVALETETGLGLFPVRHLAESWGGIVEWSPLAGGGATFAITWKDGAGHE